MSDQIPSLIDNIFSNNHQQYILNDNIHSTLSEHFSQFALVIREKIVRQIIMFGRNYSIKNFLRIILGMMFQFKDGNKILMMQTY